jgi:hypothetical protein
MARPRNDQLLLLGFVAVLLLVVGVIGLVVWRARGGGEVTGPAGLETSADPLAEERAAVLTAYDGYVRAAVEANRRGDPSYDGLDLYTGGVLRLQVAEGITQHNEGGRYYSGELKSEAATVDSIDLNADPATATISACMDDTEYVLVYRADDSPVPGMSAGGRYKAEATATKNTDGRWLITAAVAHWDQAC